MRTRPAPVIMLAVLSPLTAEFLLGDQYLRGLAPVGQQLGMLVSFIAFYGMAAVLIRELGRRLRVGWPGLLLIALGYGIFEEGLITQTLFNPHYLGLDLLSPGHIPVLGMGAPWTVFVLSLHVIWSIGTPIAIVEAWTGRSGRADTGPWLGRVGIIICAALLVIGAAVTFVFSAYGTSAPFIAAPGQLIGAAVAAALAVLAGVLLRGRDGGDRSASTLRTSVRRGLLVAAGFGLVATTGFQLANRLLDGLPWLGAAAMLAIWAMALLIMNRLRPVPYGVAIGAVITYAWVGLLPAIGAGPVATIEQGCLVVVFAAVLLWSGRRLQRAVIAADSVPSSAPRSRPGRSADRV